MLKNKTTFALAIAAVTTMSMAFSAFAAEKEYKETTAEPAKSATCDYSIVATEPDGSQKISLSDLKKDKDGNFYATAPDGTKIIISTTRPEQGEDEDITVSFVTKEYSGN
ncbi:hypothetical protein [Clostridium transplantifaecale]|uniref:hypothetical protein n=1 Tax=Clostridium transplantifaecale TaxID=2479838 RepID=UPI000F6360BB|nr:hypothetical protein [Clostridium transplantifaecale]